MGTSSPDHFYFRISMFLLLKASSCTFTLMESPRPDVGTKTKPSMSVVYTGVVSIFAGKNFRAVPCGSVYDLVLSHSLQCPRRERKLVFV